MKAKKKRKKGLLYYLSVESPLDERQQLVLKSIQAETCSAALLLAFFNTYIMENYYMWCESNWGAMMLIIALGVIYMTVKRGIKGCLFGVKGARAELIVMAAWAFLFVFDLISDVKMALRGVQSEMVRDGALTTEFCGKIMYLSFFIEAAIMAVFLLREKNAAKRRTGSSDKGD